jgi:hypothetical protein
MNLSYNFLPIDWTAIAAIAATIQTLLAILVIISVWYARKSLHESRNSRAAEVLIWAAEQMDAIKPDIARLNAADQDFHKWSAEEEMAANRITVRFQRLGYMARQALIDKGHFRRMWGRDFVVLWAKLGEWVIELRRRNGEPLTVKDGAFSRVDFQLLAEEFAADFDVKS